jgi:6-phospho-beta-glucosidase
MLAESQHLTAQAALWGGRNDAIRALAANPLVMDIDRAAALYDAMAHAQRAWLPERL